MEEIIKELRKLRRKWRREVTMERRFQKSMAEKYPMGSFSYEKSVGIDIGYSSCSIAINKLIKQLENENK